MTIPSESLKRLQVEGWASLPVSNRIDLNIHITSIARDLGTVIKSRSGESTETIAPKGEGAARVTSLSHRFGLGALPLHSDTAHWTLPSRYIILACSETGSVPTPTLLVDAHDPGFSDHECLLLRSSTFLVRNGGRSFYASIFDRRRQFVRFDPGCMEPVTDSSTTAMQLYGIQRQQNRVISHDWNEGHVLIIDNWRMLHGRGNDAPADPERRLIRVYAR